MCALLRRSRDLPEERGSGVVWEGVRGEEEEVGGRTSPSIEPADRGGGDGGRVRRGGGRRGRGGGWSTDGRRGSGEGVGKDLGREGIRSGIPDLSQPD